MNSTVPTVTLNNDQDAAVNGFFNFLLSPDKEMGIVGPGGVGKTFTMGHMIDVIMPQYYQTCKIMGIAPEFDEVHMTATTNKAAEVLSLAANRPTQTIQSFLNLKVQDDYSSGKSTLERTRNWKVHQRKIIFVDECSTIDTPLSQMIGEGTQACKIVYVGDHCQMNPIYEEMSPIFRKNIPFFELKEQMRNNNQPDLMAVCQQLRDTVETGIFKPIKLVPGVIDLLDDTKLEAEINSTFSQQTLNSRILAYTNERVIQYNDHIRDVRGLPDAFILGEYLINNSAIQLRAGRLTVEEEVQITKMASNIEKLEIVPDVFIEIRRVDLTNRLGVTHTNVMLPVDREHYSQLVKYFARMKKWERYFFLKNNFPDLRQRDASTVYKAQGSTLDTVFIDLGNISRCNNPSQAARMLYVAFSRARNRIFLYGDLSVKYGGLIH